MPPLFLKPGKNNKRKTITKQKIKQDENIIDTFIICQHVNEMLHNEFLNFTQTGMQLRERVIWVLSF